MTQEDKNIITSEINRRLKQLWFSSSMQADNDDYYRNPVVKELKSLAVFIANIKETEKILFENSNSYYVYSFDKNEKKEFKKLVLNEDKCIISSDMYYGLFFDSYKNEILFYGFNNIYDKKEILKIETIYNKPFIIKNIMYQE